MSLPHSKRTRVRAWALPALFGALAAVCLQYAIGGLTTEEKDTRWRFFAVTPTGIVQLAESQDHKIALDEGCVEFMSADTDLGFIVCDGWFAGEEQR